MAIMTNSPMSVGYVLEDLSYNYQVDDKTLDIIEHCLEGWEDIVAKLVHEGCIGVQGEKCLMARSIRQ